MNLIELAEKHKVEVKEIEEFLKNKGVILFSPTFPISIDIEKMIVEELISTVSPNMKNESPNTSQANEMLETLFGESDISILERCIRDGYHVVIDTCSILRKSHAFEYFYQRCKPLLKKYNQKLLVPYSVVAELGNMICNKTKDASTLKRVEFGIETIKKEAKDGYIEIWGNREDVWKKKNGKTGYFADPDFTVQILTWRNNGEDILLITQDYKMTLSALKFKDIPCVESDANIIVRKLNHLGFLVNALKNEDENAQ